MITQTELHNILDYDPLTGIFRWKNPKPRSGLRPLDIAGCYDNYGYQIINISKKIYKAHRLAWLYVYGQFPAKHLDHINCIRDDNRIINLRECNNAENQQNCKKNTRNSSGYKGVDYVKANNRWRATIYHDKKSYHLGYFDTAQEAYKAYLDGKAKYHTFNPIQR
jgi:hypothetical protein